MNIPLGQYWELLYGYLMPARGKVAALTVLLFGGIGMQLINPQIMRTFLDSASAGAPLSELTATAFIFFVVALLQQAVVLIEVYFSQDIAWTTTNAVRYDLAKHLLHLDLSFHNLRKPGELIERIDGDVTALANFFSQFVILVMGNLIFLIGVLILLYREDWRVGAALTVFVVITLLIMARLRNIGVPFWKGASQAGADFFGFLEERLAGTQDIRANGAKAYVMRRFFELIRNWFRKQVKAALMTNVMVNTSFLMIALGTAIAFIAGGYLYLDGRITLGSVYLIFQYTTMLMRPIEGITSQLEDLQKAGASIMRINELWRIETRVPDGPGIVLPAGPLGVAFDHVTFGYEDDEPVLHDLSFTLEPGKVLGLLGRTGSGKTTISRLLLRLYDPGQGVVRIGGAGALLDIRDAKQAELRQYVGMVTQNVQLFNATVRDNLTFFDPTVPDAVIQEALNDLGLTHWYETLPEGLDTMLASGGGGLSAGEAQLLAFTRIFLCNPGLVILDEASSRLDPATEQMIERAIDKLLRDRTGIIIAHRLGTVHRADEILILEGGRIVEHGNREALVSSQESRFYHLLQTGLEEVLV